MDLEIKRRLFLGDEWLYYKLYGGPQQLENILVNQVYPKLIELKCNGKIESYFFLRFANPNYHIRLRLFVPNRDCLGDVILVINQLLSKYVSNRLIYKVEIDTYVREIERYGIKTITLSERLFSYDSELILNYLSISENIEQEYRWIFGVRLIDKYLNNFKFTVLEKKMLFDRLSKGYVKEFGEGKALRLQLDKKFRKYRPILNSILRNDTYSDQYDVIIDSFFKNTKETCEKIIITVKTEVSDTDLFSLLDSYIHMHFNRLFRTKQRASELVIYYLLSKFYQSYLAQQKYSQKPQL